mmetsp:Transcript_31176/g.41407  ORF Transcript_31176/g.41407 Transcript_31176/m.41407 type:complete len:210 (+) Transcript_31176:1637-2266(+)
MHRALVVILYCAEIFHLSGDTCLDHLIESEEGGGCVHPMNCLRGSLGHWKEGREVGLKKMVHREKDTVNRGKEDLWCNHAHQDPVVDLVIYYGRMTKEDHVVQVGNPCNDCFQAVVVLHHIYHHRIFRNHHCVEAGAVPESDGILCPHHNHFHYTHPHEKVYCRNDLYLWEEDLVHLGNNHYHGVNKEDHCDNHFLVEEVEDLIQAILQ